MAQPPGSGSGDDDRARKMRMAASVVDRGMLPGSRPAALARLWIPETFGSRLRSRAELVARCGTGRGFVVQYDGAAHSVSRDRCRDRLCLRCWAMSASSREPEAVAVVDAATALGYSVAFVTLTRRPDDMSLVDPMDSIATTRAIWRVVRQNTRRHTSVVGGVVRWEVTWTGRGSYRCHCHAHVLLIVDGDAEAAGERLVASWRHACSSAEFVTSPKGQKVVLLEAEDGHEPVTKYLLKYLAKAGDVKHPAIVALAAWAWRGVRVVDWFGSLHGSATRARAPHAFAAVAAAARAAVRAERARYTVATIGADIIDDLPADALADVVRTAREDAPLWHAGREAFAVLEHAERNGWPDGSLRSLRLLAAALPLTVGVSEMLGLAVPAARTRPDQEPEEPDCGSGEGDEG